MAEKKPEWFEDKVYGRISNVEKAGTEVSVRVNGVKTVYPDGFVGWIPRAYVDTLENAVTIEHKNMGLGIPPREIRKPRFLFNEMMEPEKAEGDAKIVESIVESKKADAEEVKKPRTVRVTNDDVSSDLQQGDL